MSGGWSDPDWRAAMRASLEMRAQEKPFYPKDRRPPGDPFRGRPWARKAEAVAICIAAGLFLWGVLQALLQGHLWYM